MSASVTTIYQQNVELSAERIKHYHQKVNLYSAWRLAVFVCVLVLVYWSVKQDSLLLFVVGVLALGVLFNWLIRRQNWFEKQKNYFENFKAVNQNELNSIAKQENLYNNGQTYASDKHYYTADLDIFGPASLFQLINRAATVPGNELLAAWLQAPAGKTKVEGRQQAVQEIAGKSEWKLRLQALLLFNRQQGSDELWCLFRYLHQPVAIPGERWLRYYVKVAPVVFIAAIIGSIYYAPLKHLATVIGLFNFFIAGYINKATQQTDLIAGRIGNTLNNYADVFEAIEQQNWQTNHTLNLSNKIKPASGKSTAAIVKQLSGLINGLNNRLNLLVGALLNVVLVWNARYIIAIEDWKRTNHESIEGAFDAIAGFEAIISLSSLAINYPEWCYPTIAEGVGYTLTGENIAHPLIKPALRVANHYELNNTRHIDIITGSNMAGKSTFLRTLGINTVLALAGAPVCAQHMQVSVVQLFSYMRIKDSLNESTSTFKAELDRLQMLLQAVEARPDIFFLIDEMLRGTNSVDKYLGSKAVIERLIAQQGVGLVATHDLQLAELEKQYPQYIRNYYFDIQVIDGEMLFDYKLKPGECKTFNASLLLERIGIKTQAD